ncbi:MAG: hypothetical protein ACYSU6_05600 [Planctomycetota bacterium]
MKVTKLLASICLCALCGCSLIEHLRPQGPPYDEDLPVAYDRTRIKTSTSSDVLAVIHRPQYEALSQSKSVIASLGQKNDGYKTWFNMVAFDENALTARRKYFFLVDERGKALFGPKRTLKFNCQLVLESEVLDEPYADKNARQIAILKQVLNDFRKDLDQVAEDNKTLDICGMLVNQTMETVLRKLNSSPALASNLGEAKGLDFDHITLGSGRISMIGIMDDMVSVNINISSLTWTFEDPFALEE